MKKLALLIVLALFIQFAVSAQFGEPCMPDGIQFTTQEQIDNFQTNYPNCTEIEGDVIISGADITNLIGLNVLTSIGGGLEIYNSDSLANLTGLEGLTSIGGGLIIGKGYYDNRSLTSLTGLDNLTSIGGDIYFHGNYAITSLTGLEGLTIIQGALTITSNYSLTSLTGLEGLTSIGEDLQISFAYSLTSLEGLENVTTIGGNLLIFGNENLISLTGLDNLTSIPGVLVIGVFFEPPNAGGGNTALKSLSGLNNLTFIGGLSIQHNDSLISLTGLDNVNSIGGGLIIAGNKSLTSLTGLDNVNSIPGSLSIYSNNALASLSGLDNVTSVEGNLSIGFFIGRGGYSGNDYLTNLSGLDNLISVGGSLCIYANDNLTNLTGLENVAAIGGSLSIRYNTSITSLSGLDDIAADSITDLYITDNDSLSTCEAPWLCDYLASPSGTVNIYNNAAGCNNPPEIASACGITLPCLPFGNYYFFTQSEIDNFPNSYPDCTILEGDVEINGADITNLNGLSVLTSIGGDFLIGRDIYPFPRNPNLTCLSGLDNVTSIGGYLHIEQNYVLTSLTGLENLKSIGGYLSVSHNDALTTLQGLNNIDATSISSLHIYNNTSLSACEVQSICYYLSIPGSIIEIHDNATGCDSQEEVDEACPNVFINEFKIQNSELKIQIHPNPFSTSTTIEYELPQPGTVRITIFNQFGAQVDIIEQSQQHGLNKFVWKPKNLPNGIYYLRLQTGKQMASGKVVLMK